MADGKTFSRGEIERSAAAGKAVLLVIENDVYDVTPFLDEHPGGHEVLQNLAGRDASEDFADVGHSMDAKQMMSKFRVGTVPEDERRAPVRRQARWEQQQDPAPPRALWRLPLLLALAATLLYWLFY